MRYLPLDSEQMRVAQEESHALWHDSKTLEARWEKLQRLLQWPGRPLRYFGLVDDAGALVCSNKLYSFDLQLGGAPCKTLGLGALFTKKEARGKGHAAVLLEQLFALAQAEQVQAILLWSEIGSAYYERFGFQILPLRRSKVAVEDLGGELTIRVARSDDLPFMHELYEKRSKELWSFWRTLQDAEDFIVGGKEPTGYFTCSLQKHTLFLHEARAVPGKDEELRRALHAHARALGATEIEAWEGAFPALGGVLEPVVSPVPMIRFLEYSVIARSASDEAIQLLSMSLPRVEHF